MSMQVPLRRWRKLVDGLESQGCKVRRTPEGWFVLFPHGRGGTSIHLTNSDYRSIRNMRGTIKRAGLTWPGL